MADSRETVPRLSVVVPVFNEQDNIAAFLARLTATLRACPQLAPLMQTTEVVFVDDGSRDQTADRVRAAAEGHADPNPGHRNKADAFAGSASSDSEAPIDNPRVRLVRLSRNFGHQAALVAGLEHARGVAVVMMDGDLQHPPELIPKLLERRDAGAEIVQAVRRAPADDQLMKRAGSRLFYRLLSGVSRIQVTQGASDFRLMSREAVDAFLLCRERARFNRGLVQWIGFRCDEVLYDAEPRHAGRSKYSWRAMLRLAGDAVFSFSTLPLRLAGLAGVCVSLAASAYLLFVLWARLFTDRTQPGWTSLTAAVLIIGGVQLIVLWILGEYIGRLYEEAKQRPLFVVRQEQTPSREKETR